MLVEVKIPLASKARRTCSRNFETTSAGRESDGQETEIARISKFPDQARARHVADQDAKDLSRRSLPPTGVGAVDFGQMDVECGNCGALHVLAERKIGSSRTNQTFSNCCQ